MVKPGGTTGLYRGRVMKKLCVHSQYDNCLANTSVKSTKCLDANRGLALSPQPTAQPENLI